MDLQTFANLLGNFAAVFSAAFQVVVAVRGKKKEPPVAADGSEGGNDSHESNPPQP